MLSTAKPMTRKGSQSFWSRIGLVIALLLIGSGTVPSIAAPPKSRTPTGWEVHFGADGIDPNRWVIAEGWAPGYIPSNHLGYYDPQNVTVEGGYLVMLLTQESGLVDNTPGIISRGGLIYTRGAYGYGTYEWRMRMSSTSSSPSGDGTGTSGSVSAGFIYVNNSETEIDMEYSGHEPETLFLSSWFNRDPTTDPTGNDVTSVAVPAFGLNTEFRTYKFVWSKNRINFYINNVMQATITTDVPRAPAHFMINHWGTNSPYFGGTATVGTPRYFYIDWVRYTPPR